MTTGRLRSLECGSSTRPCCLRSSRAPLSGVVPSLRLVDVLELDKDEAVGRRCARQRRSVVEATGEIFAARSFDGRHSPRQSVFPAGITGSSPPTSRKGGGRHWSSTTVEWARLAMAHSKDFRRGCVTGVSSTCRVSSNRAARIYGGPLALVGHSMGGFATGLAHNNDLIYRQLNIATLSGYWGHMARPECYRVWRSMGYVAPVLGRIVGDLPGSLIGGEDLPGRAFLEWARWRMMPGFFFDDPTLGETAISLTSVRRYALPRLRTTRGVRRPRWVTWRAILLPVSIARSGQCGWQTLVARESGTPASSAASFATRFGRGRPIGWTARQLRVEHLGSLTVGVIGPRTDRIAEHARR